MALQSFLFAGDSRLEGCLTRDQDHVTVGCVGRYVRLIQAALIALDDSVISPSELLDERYGETTAQAVLKFKQARSIINHSYQSAADDVVGKMTIAALDKELFERQSRVTPQRRDGRRTISPPGFREIEAGVFIEQQLAQARAARQIGGKPPR